MLKHIATSYILIIKLFFKVAFNRTHSLCLSLLNPMKIEFDLK